MTNPDGTLHRYAWIGETLIPLEPTSHPEDVAPVDPLETLAADLAYLAQTVLEMWNPPERVMLEEPNEDEITINTDSRLVDEFLLNPAAIVFLDDVANEYGVEDPAFFSAMVATIIYRESQDPLGFGLPNADNPTYQHNWDKFKTLLHLPWYFGSPAKQLEGGPSVGIGALRMDAALRIESDARKLGWQIYFPALEFDLQTNLDEVPFSRGNHIIERYAGSEIFAPKQTLQVVPPSNVEQGVWRVELPSLAKGSDLRKSYEPTLGLLAAEVAIAIRSSSYRDIAGETEGEIENQRIAFLIANHANRSSAPAVKDYDPAKFSSDTYKEIRWAAEFEELMDARRT